ncbi:MAG: 2Fe-2S iron-sulfur cluster binding domain-containing protein, partial [Candidatus Bathyarchaeota archaeon]
VNMNDEALIPYVSIYLNGKNHRVPADLTIVDAMEYAGYRLLRGVGCHQWMCGAGVTLYR